MIKVILRLYNWCSRISTLTTKQHLSAIFEHRSVKAKEVPPSLTSVVIRRRLCPSALLPFCPSAQILLIIFFSTNFAFAQSRIDRIEPPNWWTGMKNPAVQLMIHGENISGLTPSIKYSGVKITKVTKTENPNYLFIDLSINKKAKAGELTLEFYHGRTLAESHSWELEAREAGSADRIGFNSSDVIYLITPDRFSNGDPSNDDVPGMKEKSNRAYKGGRHGGDIEGVRQHLDYIQGMGFTAIWMMPVTENDMQRSSYHGYSTTDYYKVDARFGTNEAFRQLVQESRAAGLKHIMDMIPNHCGSEHWWMNDLPSADWLNMWSTYTQSNHRKTAALDPYVSEYDAKLFTDGWFVPTMPDLNQRNPLMANYLIQNAIWWTEYLGLAGMRVDTYPYSDAEFLTEYCRRILEEYPRLNIVGEQWHTVPYIVAYWQKGVVNENGYVSYLASLMDFPVHHALISSLNQQGGWDDTWLELYETLAQDVVYADPDNLLVFTDNHDMSRIFTQVNEDYDLYRLAMAFICTTRGIPQVFYGDEILMKHPGTDEHTVIRSDFPGGWDGDAVNGFSGEGLSEQEKTAQDFVKKLFQWRKTASVIHTGKLMHFSPKDNIYVYFRYDDKNKVMVILNKHKGASGLSLDPFAEMLRGITTGRDALTGTEYVMRGNLMLNGPGPVILELK
ncbi:MAG TPA: glycoside hydrolase family 13 protein [Saprospiraceae bacterium]|nr:glycoside hydrolase family 13 protein [Saprospiraceae bacterium]